MVGICRGFQLLAHVFGQFDLDSDVPKHLGYNHNITDCNGKEFYVAGDHHQVVSSSHNMRVIAKSEDGIIESGYWHQHRAFGVQYHPEWMDPRSIGRRWFVSRCEDLINNKLLEWIR